MSGVIDRINIDDEGVEIVDLKTNKVFNKKKLMKYYSPQLRFYAFVAGKILRRNINKSTILFLENGEKIAVDISKEKIDETISELKEFLLFVKNNETMDNYIKSHNCSNCDYNNFCNNIELS